MGWHVLKSYLILKANHVKNVTHLSQLKSFGNNSFNKVSYTTTSILHFNNNANYFILTVLLKLANLHERIMYWKEICLYCQYLRQENLIYIYYHPIFFPECLISNSLLHSYSTVSGLFNLMWIFSLHIFLLS